MPRIHDNLTDIAIYLYHTVADAEAGSDIGGTGFLVGIPAEGKPGQSWVVAVTNKHIIEQGAPIVRINNKAGSTTVFQLSKQDWLFHEGGQDLAVAPLRVRQDFHKYRFIAISGLLEKDKIEALEIGLGTDTFLVGRFIGQDGGQTNTPTVRFGNIAQMPTIIVNEHGEPQESFLIETRSIGGFSGSPVFGYKLPYQFKPNAEKEIDAGMYWGPCVIGVNWGHAGQVEGVFDLQGNELDMFVQSNTGLAFATPAWRLLELLNSKALKERLEGTPQLFGAADFGVPPELRLWKG